MSEKVPETVSYAALLLVINNRSHLPRSVQEQRYFIDLANELIRLYWIYEADSRERGEHGRKAA